MARFLVTVLALSALIALAMAADNTTTAAGSANQTPKPTDPPRTNASTTSTTQNTTASSANQTPKPTDPPVTSQATPKPTDPPRTNASTTSNTQNTTAASNPSGIVQNTTAPASANQTPKPTDPPVTSQATPKPTDPPRTNASTTSNTQNTTAASNPSGSGTFQNTTAPASANQTPKPTDPPVTSQATPKPTDPPRTDASSGVQNTTKPTDPPRTDLPTVPATTAPQSVPTTKLPTDAPRSDAPNTTKPTDPPRTAFPTDPTTGNRTDPPRTDGPSSGNKTDAPRTAFPTDPTTGNRTDPPRTAFPTDPTTGNKTDLPRTDRPDGNKTDLPFTTSLRPSGNGTNGSRTDRPQPTDTQTAPRTDIPRTDLPDNRTDAPRNRTDMPFTNVPRTDKPAPVTRPPCSPNLTLTVGGTYTFSSSQVARVYLGLADGALCGLTPIVMWKVGTLAVQGSVFTSQLPAGTYQGTVSVTLGTSATSASTQASFTIVVTPPPATIQIRGGDRQVAVGSSITFVAAATSAKTVSWSCCVYGDNGACASATCTFTSSMLDSSFVGTLATGFPTAGKYVVTATSDAQVSATVNVLVISAATQVNTVQLQTGASSSVYVGTTITIVAQAADGSKYAWTATDGSTSGNAVANFKPSSTGTFNVTVTATSKAGVVGTASLSFTVMPLPTGTLTVTSTDSPIVGGTSSLTLTLSQWTGPSTATFRFGYLQYGQWNALSDDFGTTTTQTYTAPLVVVDRSIVFAVQALMGKQRLDPITAAVTVTAPVNKTAAVAERQAAMNAAAAAKDISTVLRAALDVADASTPSTSTTGSATAGSNSATTISSASSAAVAAVASVVTTTMSSTQKGAAIDVLASALNSTGTDSVKTDANTQKEVVQCLAAVLSGANTSAATSTDAVDTSTRAAAMLALIGTVNATAMANDTSNRDARQQLARNLALTVAAQLSVGQTTTVQSSDMNITAAKVPVSASQPTAVSTPQASISIPLAALASAMAASVDVVAQSGTNVAVSATSHATNPVPTAKTPSGSNISSAIVEFDVTASGASFSSLSSPITIRLQANATKDGKPPACVYFDATSNTWSTAGLVTTDYNATDKTVGCNTTHLSMFAATVSADAGATSSTTSSPSSPASSGTDNTGIYAAVGICVGVLFIAGVVIVRRRQTAEAARHPTEEPLNGMGQLQVPMQQQPQRPVAYDPYNRV